MKPLSRAFLPVFSAASVVAWLSHGPDLVRAAGASDELALGVRTTNPLTPAEQQARFNLPPGFQIQLVATEPDIHKPMNMAMDALGRLWVTTSIEYPFAAPPDRVGRDRLMIFEDFGPDGRARKITEFAGGLNIPIGIHPWRSVNADGRETWKALVWSIPNIWLLEDTDGDGKADRKEIAYGPFDHTRDTHGNQASFRRGFDGWLYATHGFNNDSHVRSRDGNRVDLNSGNTYRVRLDGSRIEHHTHGQVNPFGLAWDERGNLYSSDCHSAPIYQLLGGGWYPSFGKPHDGLGFAPVLMEHAHGSTAIDGACYITDDLWPADFRDGFLIGNVMTSRLNRDRIVFTGSSPRAEEQPDFLTTTDPWFRPVDTCLAPDGALYIADFYNRIIGHYEVPLQHPGRDRERGRLWRVVPVGVDGTPRLRRGALADTVDGLVEELGSGSLSRRLLAMEELGDRFGLRGVDAVRRALASPRNPQQIVHGLWMLQRMDALRPEDLTAAGAHSETLVRVHARRIGTDVLGKSGVASALRDAALAVGTSGITDPDALVRRCAAEVLGAAPSAAGFERVLTAWMQADRADTHLVYVLRKSVRDHLRAPGLGAELLVRDGWTPEQMTALADIALAVDTPSASGFLLRWLEKGPKSGGPAAAEVLRHAARNAPESEFNRLAELARSRFAGDPGSQLSLYQSVEKGLRQRGAESTGQLALWGASIAAQILGDRDPAAGWSNQTLPAAPTANPWEIQERAFADGTRGPVLSSFPHGEALTGILRSAPFEVRGPIAFWVCGHDGFPDKPAQGLNRVRLLDATTGEVLAEARPPRNDTAQRVEWPMDRHFGKRAVFEVVDGDTAAAFAWIAVGRFETRSLRMPAVGLRAAGEQVAGAAELAGRFRLTNAMPALTRILQERHADPDVRMAAARGVLGLAGAGALDGLRDRFMDSAESGPFVERLGEMLAGQRIPAARAIVLGVLKTAPQRLQSRWAAALAGSSDGASELLSAVEGRQLPARLLALPAVRARVVAAQVSDAAARIERIARSLPPSDTARDALIAARRKAWETGAGTSDVAVGERLFQQQCAACHQINGRGGLVGPQLTGIGNRGAERLCEDVLDPNRNVDHAFRQTLLTLKSGDTVSGLFRRDDGAQVILANAAGVEVAVARAEIVRREDSDLSLMPDNFGEAIPESEFRHLLAYLLAQKGSGR